MAVAFVSAGTAVAGTTSLTVAWPGSQSSGDIGLLLIETANAATVVASGWTELASSPVESAVSTHGLHVLYKIAAGSDADVSVSGLLNHAIARILVFSGVDGTSPINDTTQQAASTGTSITLPSVTTDASNCAIVHIAGTGRDTTSTAVFSDWANSNLASITEVADDTTGTAGGGGFGAAWGILASAGASGTGSCTQSVSVIWTAITVALKPAAGGGSPQTISVTNPSETDSSQSITSAFGALSVSVGYANESSVAQTLTPSIGLIVSIGHATESDSSQTITASTGINISLAHAVDTNFAQSIAATTGSLDVSVAHASENNAAQEITVSASLSVLISAATESDVAQTVTAVTSSGSSIDSAYEVDSSQAITASFGALLLSIGSASEIDSAQLITPSNGLSISLGAAYETATVQAISPVTGGLIVTFNVASEIDSSRAITVFIPSDAISMTPTCRTVSVERDLRSVNIDMDFSRCIAVPFDSRTVLVGGCNA